jgi:hypothetical protein
MKYKNSTESEIQKLLSESGKMISLMKDLGKLEIDKFNFCTREVDCRNKREKWIENQRVDTVSEVQKDEVVQNKKWIIQMGPKENEAQQVLWHRFKRCWNKRRETETRKTTEEMDIPKVDES